MYVRKSEQVQILPAEISEGSYVKEFSAVFYEYDESEGFSIIAFITLYTIGSFLARCKDIKRKWCVVILSASTSIMLASKIALCLITDKLNLGFGTSLFYHYNSIFALMNAVAIFELFKQITYADTIKKLFAMISPSVFSVYLLHGKPAIRKILWNVALRNYLLQISCLKYMICVIGISIAIFCGCILVDKLLEFIAFNRINKYIDFAGEKIELLSGTMSRRIQNMIQKETQH